MAKRQPDQPEYYTVEEAAKLLRINRDTLFVYIRTGKIQSRKLGRRRLIPWYEVRAEREDTGE
jgi:excisionase family DNA binding protein